ncbi:hypothetical protein [Lentzea atacamensis]|uniref:hypothetical protein n=1 Tax=Lentzea atacamensis TaxID=531938 RepID=UPI001F3D106C|nr:hypothetical protein [Lentzea atacamensis]
MVTSTPGAGVQHAAGELVDLPVDQHGERGAGNVVLGAEGVEQLEGLSSRAT